MAQTIFTHLINSSRPRFLSKLVRDRKEKTFYDDKEDDWEQSVSGIFLGTEFAVVQCRV